jgi:hypothetical protein
MARPITWQDVAGPAQTPGLLIAANQFSKGISENLAGIGESFATIGAKQKEAATGAAVASIANAEDPMAAMAALPQDNKFIDPLAVSVAANARTDQLLSTKQKNTSIAADELKMQDTRSEMADRESKRQIAVMIAPYEALARSGKDFDVDESDPIWQTPAGFEAKKHLEELRNTAFNQRIEADKAAAAKTQARAASLQLEMTLAQKKADDEYVAWKQTDAGMAASPADDQDAARAIGQRTGAGEAYGFGLINRFAGTRGIATEPELARHSPQGIPYDSTINALTADTSRLEKEKAVATRDLQLAAAGARAMEKNNYAGMAAEALNLAVLENNTDMANGEGWFRLSKNSEDVQDHRDAAADRARAIVGDVATRLKLPVPDKDYIPLMPEQEANIAELTLAGNKAAAADLTRQYVAFNLVGGNAGLAVIEKERTSPFDTAIEKNRRLAQKTEAAAVGGNAIPKEAVDAYGRTAAGRAYNQAKPEPWDFVTRSLQNGQNQR